MGKGEGPPGVLGPRGPFWGGPGDPRGPPGVPGGRKTSENKTLESPPDCPNESSELIARPAGGVARSEISDHIGSQFKHYACGAPDAAGRGRGGPHRMGP